MFLAHLGLIGLLLAAALAAAVIGGPRERVGASLLLACSVATLLMPLAVRDSAAPWVLLTLDVAGVLVLGRMSWKAPRLWPLWMMAAEAVAAAASLAFLLQPDVGAETYLKGVLFTRYAMAGALLLGIRRSSPAHP
jgi:hypothetical protein